MTNKPRRRSLGCCVVALSLLAAAHYCPASPEKAAALAGRTAGEILSEVNARIEKEFIGGDGLLLDYVGDIPTPEEIADLKPSAMGWKTPISNGTMFTGEWLPAVMSEGASKKGLVERCVKGLIKMSEISDVPGFIARGTGTDGKSHYPCGSNDQTDPWFFSLLEYCRWPHADSGLRARAMERLVCVARALKANGWKLPCDGAFKGENRGNLASDGMPFWAKTRFLYSLKSLHRLTGDRQWEECYESVKADALDAIESGGESDAKFYKACFGGGVWIYIPSVQALSRLVELEENESDRARMKKGLLLYASRVAPLMDRRTRYDNSAERPLKFMNWRDGFYWPPQRPRKKAQDVHYSSKPEILGKRRDFECDYMRIPLAAAAVCAIADAERYRGEILSTLRHYDYSTPNLCEFFYAAIAAAAMRFEGK